MRSALILLAALLVVLFVFASLPACVPSIYYCHADGPERWSCTVVHSVMCPGGTEPTTEELLAMLVAEGVLWRIEEIGKPDRFVSDLEEGL